MIDEKDKPEGEAVQKVDNVNGVEWAADYSKSFEQLNAEIDRIRDVQSKMVEVLKRTQEMQITYPQAKIEVLTDNEKFVLDTIDEYKQNPHVKWSYPSESKKFDVIIKYVLEGMDPKDIAKRYE